jgi:predicted P-loop ATPase
MNIENTIITMSPELIFNSDLIDAIYGIEDDLEKARILAIYKAKAKEFKLEKELSAMLKVYNSAEQKLADNYKRINAKKYDDVVLDYDGRGNPLVTVENFVRVLHSDERFNGIKFNLLTYSPEKMVLGKMEKWTDADDAKTRHYIEKKYKLHSVQKCDDALRIVFEENEYHPIKEIINGLVWDGESRIYDFLNRWTQCENTEYTREVSRLIFAGGINRIYNPGCKFDDMPVLIGTRQGEGKSTLVRWLAMDDAYFTEISDFEGETAMQALEGAWICEVSELLALTKTKEQEAVKSFLTRMNDRRKIPYDRRTTDHKRQCIFIGTTNKEQFLTDKTGGRRFYPVKIDQSGYYLYDNKEEIKEYIRQCWAEAKKMYDEGKLLPYADRRLTDVFRQKQMAATEDDYRDGMVSAFLEDKNEVCVLEIWRDALQMSEFVKPTKKDSNEIGIIMQNQIGWIKQERVKRFEKWGVQKYWARAKPAEKPELTF